VRINFQDNGLAKNAGPGHWNDPDMLEIGNGKLTPTEERTHFALWAIGKAPLIIGCDLTTVSDESLAILKNEHLIKLNQDSLGYQARCVQGCESDVEVYQSLQSGDGSYHALAIVNWHDTETKGFTVDLMESGVAATKEDNCVLTDLWTGKHLGTFQGKYTFMNIPPHGHQIVRVSCMTHVPAQKAQFLTSQ